MERTRNLKMKISEKKKSEYLKSIIRAYLHTNIEIMTYLKANAPDTKSKRVCTKVIKDTELAITHLDTFKRIEILDYLYASIVGNNVIAYSVSPKLILSKRLVEIDNDDEKYQDFLADLEEQRIYNEKKYQERLEYQQAIESAKKQGKKVEMVYDKDKKKIIPTIVEDKK